MRKFFANIISILLFAFFGSSSYTLASNYELSPTSTVLFECKNVIQIETYYWPKSLVTYPISFSGSIFEKDLVLMNKKTRKEEIFQLSNIKANNNGLISADINFMTDLPLGGIYQYELAVKKGENKTMSERLAIVNKPEGFEIAGNLLQIRLPKSTNIQAYEAPAPIISINQGSSWIGNNKISSPTKKILSLQSETVEQGVLFTQQVITYQFDGGSEYIAKVMLVKDYPFVILDETMSNLSENDLVKIDMEWSGFNPTKRFGTQWDRNLESDDVWLDIDKPIYTSYSKEDPRWTGMGWIEDPSKQMIFRISPFGGNSVREQTPVMSFWEEEAKGRELGVFVYDHNKWNDRQYGIWQPTPILSVYFRYADNKLHFTYPLVSGTRSTALSLFAKEDGAKAVTDFNAKLNAIAQRGGKHDPKDMYYRYSQMLLMQYASLSLNRIKDWQLTYPEDARRPENPFHGRKVSNADEFMKQMSISPMAYYPMGLNFYPGIHSIEHRILYSSYVEDYLRFYKELTTEQRQTVEALFILGGYVNTLEEMNSIRNALAGTANMASDGWSVPPQIAFLFPEHSMAREWTDFFEKQLEINGLFYTRPDVNLYESNGGRWVESLGIYNWAFLRPTSHSNIASELFDGKNRFSSPYMAARGRWMRDMLTAPIADKGRCFPPHGAHGGGYLVPRYMPMYQTAQWLTNFDPIIAENIFWTGSEGQSVEAKPNDSDWESAYDKTHPKHLTGTNPHLKSTKYTGHGIVLRAGVDTSDELSIHLNQVDKGPNYRWGNQGEGNSGGLYFYAKGKVYTAHENEIAGDHIVNNLDGITNFGVMKDGEFRTVGMNELKAPLYDFGIAQFSELLSYNGDYKYVFPDYLSRSVMLAGSDYFILFDEVGTNWRAAGRFAWFNANGKDFPKITFLSAPARKDSWMTAQTPNSHGFYRDNFGSVLTLVTHKKEEIRVEGGRSATIALLNDENITDFIPDKKELLPTGVVKIKTAKSNDLVFRNGNTIHYEKDNETFIGKAGLIRRFTDRLELSLFKGDKIAADGISITIKSDKEAAIALTRTTDNLVEGRLKTAAPTVLKIEGLTAGGKIFANGIELKAQYSKGSLEATLPKGDYQLEYAQGKPTPMESRIIRSEYEKERVKVFIASDSPCESVRMEVSYDGGNTWKSKGYASKGMFFLPKENVEKVHLRAVSLNGKKESTFAQEYPIYFSSEAPHYPEGLWLKLAENRVDLSWGEILGVQSYRLYRRELGKNNFELIYEGKERQFSDLKLSGVKKAYAHPGALDNRGADRSRLIVYEYAIASFNANGESAKSPIENTDPASWRNWYPDTDLKFKRQSAFWMEPYVYPNMIPEKYYPD